MVDTRLGAWGNAAAIALFIFTALALVTLVDRRQSVPATLR
jgi:cobalamin synthase